MSVLCGKMQKCTVLGCYEKLRKEREGKSNNQQNHALGKVCKEEGNVKSIKVEAGVSKRQFDANGVKENVDPRNVDDLQIPAQKVPKKEQLPAGEERQPNQASSPNRIGILNRPPTNREQRQYWIKLYEHIAWNVKSGAYPLEPTKSNQCSKCRKNLSNIEQKSKHELSCQPELYNLGCPCGFLTNTMKSLAPHRASCAKSQNIRDLGVCGWIPHLNQSQPQS